MSDKPRLYVLSALMSKPDGENTLIANNLSYRVASDGEDAVIGRYVNYVMETNPGCTLAGKVSIMEVLPEDLALLEMAND